MERVKILTTKKNKWPFLFTGANIILFIIFFLIPAILGLYYSFTNSNGNPGEKIIGLANYAELFKDPSFYKSISRTFLYAICEVPLVFITSLLVAILLTNKRAKGKTLAKIIVFLPWTVSSIVTGVVWKWLFGEDVGFVNYIIQLLGGKPVGWFSNGNTAFAVIVIAAVWGATAFNMLLFMSALKNIPTSLFEAADMDGASSWEKFRNITLPQIKPTSFMVILLSTIGSMKEFAMVQSLTNGGPGTDNTFIVQYIYNTGFNKLRVGYASAVSMVLFVLLLILALIQMKIGGKTDE